jgi:hypothetical protein
LKDKIKTEFAEIPRKYERTQYLAHVAQINFQILVEKKRKGDKGREN